MIERTLIAVEDYRSKAGKIPVADTSVQCMWCGEPMRPEHAHYRCDTCGSRDSCCDGPY
jgi:Zn finger protein HypA/HybF involved in hydrogenase expression